MTYINAQSRTTTRTLETIQYLYNQGQTDGAEGGVSPLAIAAEIDVNRTTAAKHANALVDEGKLERVHGIGPNGPRSSYLPTEEL